MPLIVTRPAAQAADWLPALRALDVPACALPLIDIAALEDPAPVRAAWQTLPGCALAMFVSANAVQHFLAAGALQTTGAVWPVGVLAGSTGPGTTAALRAGGVPLEWIVEPGADAAVFDSEALWRRLQHRAWAGRRALVVRGEGGRDWLAERLREQGAEVDFVTAYRRLPPCLDATGLALLKAALAHPAAHVWHFSSSEGIGHLLDLGATLQPAADWSASLALAGHPRIVQSAIDAGFGRVEQVGNSPQDIARWLQAHAPSALAAGGAPGGAAVPRITWL